VPRAYDDDGNPIPDRRGQEPTPEELEALEAQRRAREDAARASRTDEEDS
jgi:hypothetical protein